MRLYTLAIFNMQYAVIERFRGIKFKLNTSLEAAFNIHDHSMSSIEPLTYRVYDTRIAVHGHSRLTAIGPSDRLCLLAIVICFHLTLSYYLIIELSLTFLDYP